MKKSLLGSAIASAISFAANFNAHITMASARHAPTAEKRRKIRSSYGANLQNKFDSQKLVNRRTTAKKLTVSAGRTTPQQSQF